MRITQEMLLKVAEDTVSARAAENPEIIAAYLHGSVLSGDPVMGGTADIDLVFVYEDRPERREVVRMTADVHLDIRHHPRVFYEPARQMRTDPAWGAALYICKPLYDPQHFLDFAQASVRGLYTSFDNVWGRAYPLLESARQSWMDFHNQPPELGREQVWAYLKILENIANAVAFLSGGRLAERRFFQDFPAKAEAIGQPGLYWGLVGLLGGSQLDAPRISAWLPDWEAAFRRVANLSSAPAELHEDRLRYYRSALDSQLEGERPQDALWAILRTWTFAVLQLPSNAMDIGRWATACEDLGLTGDSFAERLAALDAYLDMVEEHFEEWQTQEGA